MKFDEAAAVDQIAYEMRLADFPRSLDRQRINDLFNGVPPYTMDEVERNGIAINVNYLEGTRMAHQARMQFYGSFLKPGKFFNCKSDWGPKHKRIERSAVVTREVAKRMKNSIVYYETYRSKFASNVIHGIGPSGWDTDDLWTPDAYGIEDVLVPANTLLTMKNLPFFIKYRSYTGPELIRLIRDRDRAKEAGWNLSLADKCVAWIDQETMALSHNNWPEYWSPEKAGERVKGDGGFYAADSVPTIDCFDFYFWDDSNDKEGWCRRIILDSWSTPQSSGLSYSMQRDSKLDFGRNQFLFNSKNRKVASSWHELIAFQFADLSAVAPFRYHSVRSMGYLLYALCNLQNRLRCRFNEAIWEATLMYLRVSNRDDAERALKVELFNRGFIDPSVQFVPAAERFQVNSDLVQLGLRDNADIINQHAATMMQRQNYSEGGTEKTAFQVMSEIQAMNTLISAGFQQAYRYQDFENREIFRRFCLENSRDPDVNSFRASCQKQGVPPEMLTPEAWDIETERVLGAGNKTMEMAIAESLMQFRNLYDPDAQRAILRDYTLAVTEDPGRAINMVPEEPEVMSDSVLAAQLAAGALMQGLPVGIKSGINHIEYVDAMLVSLQVEIGRTNQRGGVPESMEKLDGFDATVKHIAQHIEIVAQDENEKERVSDWQKQLTKLANLIRAFAQRFAEKQQQQQPQGDPEAQAKIQAMLMQAKAKADNTRESHAQRTAQRQIQFEMEQKREELKAQAELARETKTKTDDMVVEQARKRLELQFKQAETATDLHAERVKTDMSLRAEHAKTRMKVAAEKAKQSMKSTKE